jgi:hypothetical protein
VPRANEFEQIKWRKKRALLIAGAIATTVALASVINEKFVFSTLIFVVVVRRLYSSLQGRMLIVWLRRFHQPKGRVVRFKRILALASARIAVPVTIRDSSIRFEQETGFLYSYSTAHWLIIPVILVVLIGAHIWFPEASESVVGLLIQVILVVAVGGTLLLILVRRRGVIRLRNDIAINQAKYLFGSLKDPHTDLPKEAWKEDDHRPYFDLLRAVPPSEVLIVETSDAIWQMVVNMGLQHADCAIIDVTDPSTNLLWELTSTSQLVSPENVVLTYAYHSGDTNDEQTRRTIMDRLREAVETEFLENCHWLPYPERVDGWQARFATERRFGKELRAFLLEHSKRIPPRVH